MDRACSSSKGLGRDHCSGAAGGVCGGLQRFECRCCRRLEAIQFTITDEGSEYKETKVKYKIKHKNKTINIESKIGIKLSKKLAKEKGLGIYGDTGDPGPFKGGKKVAKEEEEKDKDKGKGKNK
jgi:hypothetical protein